MTAERSLRWLARAGGANMGAAGVGSLAGVLLALSVTHEFSKTLAGTFFAVTSAFLILESICCLGVTTGLVKMLPDCITRGEPGDTAMTVRVALRPVLVMSTLAAVGMGVVAPALATLIVGPAAAEDASHMLRALAPFIQITACNDSVLAATRGLHSMRPTVFVENLGRLCLQPLAIVAVALTTHSAATLAVAWGAPYLVALVINVVWLKVLLRRPPGASAAILWARGERPEYLVHRSRFWAYTTPRAFATVVQTALKRSDVVLVAAMTTAAQAAVYATASRFVTFGLLGVAALQQALSPLVSRHLSQGRRSEAEVTFQTATVWMMCLAWPIYLLSGNFAGALLRVFGPGYQEGRGVVVILAVAMLFATACGPVDSVLLMAGRSWLSLFNTATALALNVGLNLVLIPRLGIAGAAISWAVAIVVRNSLPLVQLRRYEGLRPESGTAVRVGASSVLLFGLLPLSARILGLSAAVSVAVAALGAVAFTILVFGRPTFLGQMSMSHVFGGPGRAARARAGSRRST